MLLQNKRALYDYDILEKFEAGIVLLGWEAKSIRAHTANMKAAWVSVRGDEVFLLNFQVSPWRYASGEQVRDREKKLLLKKKEIRRLAAKGNEKGCAIIPLRIFDKNGKLKCEIGIGKGRKKYEKRQVLKERSMDKEARRMVGKLAR